MLNPNIAWAIAFLVCSFINGVDNLDYNDLENLEVDCSNLEDHYSCLGNISKIYSRRGCECDAACNTYNDCCIDAPNRKANRRTSTRNRMTCLPAGEDSDEGVYGIATCHNNWTGDAQIRQKCENQLDLSDPLNSAPVTSISLNITYRNSYCAECNYADMTNLQTFQVIMDSSELSEFLTDEQINADLKYDQKLNSWGVDRFDSVRNATIFFICDIYFDVPINFKNSVRSCLPNIISNCPPEFRRDSIRKACRDYMAVVYGGYKVFRNPHCAICNGRMGYETQCPNTQLRQKPKRKIKFSPLNFG